MDRPAVSTCISNTLETTRKLSEMDGSWRSPGEFMELLARSQEAIGHSPAQ